jgi:topoisomerase-4 subunit A
MSRLESLMKDHFIEYASYFILDRAIPDLRDGLKPVQRRILHTLFRMNDGRFHKVANVIGDTMKLHPHGDASIGDALVVLANKDYFIERQGNFGNLLTGHAAAAPRYIECRLTELALETMFHPALTEFVPSYDGRNDEPVALPAKLPVVLMTGAEGIAVGMATRLLPHNLPEICGRPRSPLLRHEPSSTCYPDFARRRPDGRRRPTTTAAGKRARCGRGSRRRGDKKPAIIRRAPVRHDDREPSSPRSRPRSQKGRVKIAAIDDFTDRARRDRGLELPRGVERRRGHPAALRLHRVLRQR